MQPEEQLIKQRLEKLQSLKDLGQNPYDHSYKKTHYSKDILEEFKKLKKEEKTKKKVSVSGRIMTIRGMGKAAFGNIQDFQGRIQFYIREDENPEAYKVFKKLDMGDIVGIEGTVFRTKMGEITIWCKDIRLLTKCIRPLPEKWHGLQDVELRYRQRYLDLIVNPDVKEVFQKRSQIINGIREFLTKNGYTEVETPILQPIYGGTNARPFESKLNALNMNVYMRISNELYLKRLLVGGYEKIFEFSQDFRNEGMDKTHNPEFLQVETMWCYADYRDNMDFAEEMIEYIVKKIFKKTSIEYQGKQIEFKRPWKRMTMFDAIKQYSKIDIEKCSDEELRDILNENKIIYDHDNFSRGAATEMIFEHFVEHNLIQPTLIYDFPAETSPLAKKSKKDQRFAERFEPFVNGWELGNSYSELNDPKELELNWKQQESKLQKGDIEAQRMDKDFIRALEFGMPPASGIGIGIDRLAILLTNSETIRDVIFFPFMKPENPN
jgi:lysyl-tRNA synthetase, class II